MPDTTTQPTHTATSPDAPATYRGRHRKEQLLRVACEHFLQHGYDGTSLDAVVAEAGGSKATVYQHFGNKEALFSAAIEALCAQFLQQLRSIDVLSSATLEQGLRTILEELVHVVAAPRHVAFYRLVVSGSARFPQAGRTWYEHGPMVWFDVFMKLFAQQQQLGHVAADAPKAAVATVLFDAVLSNLTTRVVILGLPADADFAASFIDELIPMALARLSPPSPSRRR